MAPTVTQSAASPQVMGPAAAIRGIAAGEALAWTWIVEHEGPAMFRVAARLLGSA
ncbi:MAG: hypothetical protein H0W72_11875, partial [Planctomycetes bacterium]|nr:hypothetical protein [Planctomycetota bacterium]